MSNFNLNLTGVGDRWPVVPEGVFNGKVVEMKQYVKPDTGNTIWMVDLIITQKGEWQDEKMRYFHTFVANKAAMSKRNMVRFLRALGVIDDVQASGDPNVQLDMGFTYGKKDEDGRIEVKGIKINGTETSVTGLRCNIISKPRSVKVEDGSERTVSSVDNLEPYAAAKGATPATKSNVQDLFSQFPK